MVNNDCESALPLKEECERLQGVLEPYKSIPIYSNPEWFGVEFNNVTFI